MIGNIFQVVEETQVLMRKIVKQVGFIKILIFIQIQERCASRIWHVFTQHVETYDEENMRDFVDVYLKEIGSSKDPSFNGNSNLKKKDFKDIIAAFPQRSSCW